jgi:hypothetical protein
MTDIVERLLAFYVGNPGPKTQVHYPPVCKEAAETITLLRSGNKHMCEEMERLRAEAGELVVTQYELAAARTALREIDETPYMVTNDSESLRHTIKSIQATARRALAVTVTSPEGKSQ